jgi:hypothetical protein
MHDIAIFQLIVMISKPDSLLLIEKSEKEAKTITHIYITDTSNTHIHN